MKTTVLIFAFSILALTGCYAQQESRLTANELTDNNLLNFYRQFSEFTDPGEYAYLYENLPDVLPELCSLIKSQIIHPYAELQYYKDQIPEERWDEYLRYPTVKSILESLVSYNPSGLVFEREPKDRLVLGCQQNAILLISILKYKGIPARVRSGHATYILPEFHASHTICEVWNENDGRWMLVDPSMNAVDINRSTFDLSNDAWIQMQNNEIDPDKYGNPGQYSGLISIVGKISPDLAAILGTEYPIDKYAPMLDDIFENNQLSANQIELLDTISELMKILNAENISKLQEIYNNTPEIQVTKTFNYETETGGTTTGIEELTRDNNFSLRQNYPNPFQFDTNIEFSIPKEGNVSITVYNTSGKTIETVFNERLPHGNHTVKFQANDLPQGIYLYSLEYGGYRQIKKMSLTR